MCESVGLVASRYLDNLQCEINELAILNSK